MPIRRPDPPLDYLHSASVSSLESYELSRLNHAANLRREIAALLDQWIEETVHAQLARWVLEDLSTATTLLPLRASRAAAAASLRSTRNPRDGRTPHRTSAETRRSTTLNPPPLDFPSPSHSATSSPVYRVHSFLPQSPTVHFRVPMFSFPVRQLVTGRFLLRIWRRVERGYGCAWLGVGQHFRR